MSLQYLNPDGLHSNPAFTQAIIVPPGTATVHIGGQNAMDAWGEIVGAGDIAAQAEQVFRNIETALTAAGTSLEHVIKWNVHVVEGQPLEPAFGVIQRVWAGRPNPPLITMLYVSGLANPDFLLEIDAVAALPQS
ncbi:MAG: RidA family protein [Bacteroidota bacterium]